MVVSIFFSVILKLLTQSDLPAVLNVPYLYWLLLALWFLAWDSSHLISPSHRITECSGLEGTSVGHLVQPPCRSSVTQSRLHRTLSRRNRETLTFPKITLDPLS